MMYIKLGAYVLKEVCKISICLAKQLAKKKELEENIAGELWLFGDAFFATSLKMSEINLKYLSFIKDFL